MFLDRLYNEPLAQASYLLGSSSAGEALVVDPLRDVQLYVRAAERRNVRITHVLETHIHADFVSGAPALAAATGARLVLSGEGGPEWQYAFAERAGARLLRDGEHVELAEIRVVALHTPGHTPEHLTYLVTDTAASDRPVGAFTGDFIFAGDVGRPDLLERAANIAGSMESAARQLYASIRRFASEQPDHLQLWPGHGAGSACGKALGEMPQTTLGYEKLANWALAPMDEDEFVAGVLGGQPDPPRYFAVMKRVNRTGPPAPVGEPRRVPKRDARDVVPLLDAGALVVDVRAATAFAASHLPGSLNLPLGKSFATWAGSLLPYDRTLYLVADGESDRALDETIHDAVRQLALIGLDDVAGYFGPEAVAAWTGAGRAPGSVARVTLPKLAERWRRNEVVVLDVRTRAEWDAGHIPGAHHIPLGSLPGRVRELPLGKSVVVHCQSGSRSAIGASVLLAHGVRAVMDFPGGFDAWSEGGLPNERAAPESARETATETEAGSVVGS